MSFSIRFLPERVTRLSRGEKAAFGAIQIGHFQERFIASLNYWSMADYKNHWREALERVVGSKKKSCLITSITDPKNTNFITWWPVYKDGRFLRFQNQLLFLEQLKSPFNPSDPYKHISSRRIINDEGQKISEWRVSVKAVKNYLMSLKRSHKVKLGIVTRLASSSSKG